MMTLIGLAISVAFLYSAAVRPGPSVPVDGAVRSGKSSVNEAMITCAVGDSESSVGQQLRQFLERAPGPEK